MRLPFYLKVISRDRVIRLGRETAWLVMGQVVGILGSLALIRVTTEYLLPEQYGQFALTLTVGVLVCQVSLSGVMPGIMRYYSLAVERGDVSRYTIESYRLMSIGVLGTVALGSVLTVLAFFSDYRAWIVGLLLSIAFAQINSFNSTLSSIQNAARQRDVVVLHGAVDPWVKIGFLGLFVLYFDKSVTSVVLAYLFTSLSLMGSQLFFFRRLVRRTPDRLQPSPTPWMREMVRYSRPFMVFNIFTWAQASSDRWALERFSETQEVGQYTVLSQLGNTPVAIAIGLITNLLGPILQQRSGDATDPARNRNVWRITWILTILALAMTFFAALIALGIHSWLFSVLVADAYMAQSYLLPWVVLGGGIFAASQVLGLKFQSDLNTRLLTIPKVTSSLIAVALNVLGAWIFGVEGVIAASVAFSILIFLWMAALARRPYGEE